MPSPRWGPGSRGPSSADDTSSMASSDAVDECPCCRWSSLRSSASRARRWASARRTSVSCRSRGGAGLSAVVIGPTMAPSPDRSVRNDGRRVVRLERVRPRSPRRIWPDRLGRPCRSACSASRRRSQSINLAETTSCSRSATDRQAGRSIRACVSLAHSGGAQLVSQQPQQAIESLGLLAKGCQFASAFGFRGSRLGRCSALQGSLLALRSPWGSDGTESWMRARAGYNRRKVLFGTWWQMLPARR